MTLLFSHFTNKPNLTAEERRRLDEAPQVEWLETNGLAGYACGTVTMCPSRRYHGLLVAPRPGTATRHVFLAGLLERVSGPDGGLDLATVSLAEEPPAKWPEALKWFRPHHPTASYAFGRYWIHRTVIMPKGRSAVLVQYWLSSNLDDDRASATADDEVVSLSLRPRLAFREADKLTVRNDVLRETVEATATGLRVKPYEALPAMTMTIDAETPDAWSFEAAPEWIQGIRYDTDLERGYEGYEDQFVPGRFDVRMREGDVVTFVASIDGPVESATAVFDSERDRWEDGFPEDREPLSPDVEGALEEFHGLLFDEAPSDGERESWIVSHDFRGRCWNAADDFLYEGPGGRSGVLAGFPWFGEWGRDTFIALPGLTLARGDLKRCAEGLSGALPYLQDGLLPNIYEADVATSHYGSVDASLWFARAVLLYERAGGSKTRVKREYLPALREIADAYAAGAAPGIRALGIAADDGGLIRVGSPELNPTWMDANAAGRAVTPRHGGPVDIEALWVSLLMHLAEIDTTKRAEHWKSAARRARRTFLERYWLEDEQMLADVWREGHVDKSVRPNMVLAAALELSPLSRAQRAAVVAKAETELLTPLGLRTLSPRDPQYVPAYRGGPDERDRAYHQGTVWPWLLGFFCEASLRVDRTRRNRDRLQDLWFELEKELDHGGLGHMNEVYDGDPPHDRGGTFAQAWNTAEALRAIALIDGSLPLRRARS